MRAVCPETGDTVVREVVFWGRRGGRFTTEVMESTEESQKQSVKQKILNAEERLVLLCSAIPLCGLSDLCGAANRSICRDSSEG